MVYRLLSSPEEEQTTGIPQEPPLADSNRRSPQEQTIYQQGGREATSLQPEEEGGLNKFLSQLPQFGEGVLHSGVTGTTEVGSTFLGAPGDIFSFINELIARPITKGITGKSLPYKETYLGKIIPTSQDIRRQLHENLPYTKPRNDYEKFTNDVLGTASLFLIPGGQARIGLFPNMSRYSRSFLKSLGVNLTGKGTEQLTGSKEKGGYAKMGSLFLLSLLDKRNANRYIGSIYNQAENALQQSGNPTVNANRLTNNLNQLRENLTQGTLAPTENAVVNEIDSILEHVQNGRIGVRNLWGSLRSTNENLQRIIREAASAPERTRARAFYRTLNRNLNQELENYGRTNPSFGVPFEEAQRGFQTINRSNLLRRAASSLIGKDINPALLHLFSGSAGGAAALAGKSVGGISSILSPGAAILGSSYGILKMLYRMNRSPALRRYYLNAINQATGGNITQFGREVEKMDKIIEKEDKNKKPYRIIKKSNS